MAGKTIEESKEARRRDRESKNNTQNSSSSSSPRVQVSVKGTDGRSYLMYTDTSSLTPLAEVNPPPWEFAGIASLKLEDLPVDDIEYNGFMATIQEENYEMKEYKASVDWNDYSTELATASAFTCSTTDYPFFLDSGASAGISPIKSNFTNLQPFSQKVKGIGGSAIEAFGIGDIKIPVTKDSYLWLKDALF
ncbi:hypothetical protein BYT27DRAFT_7315754, partial [Phlegmacium glaucopus]